MFGFIFTKIYLAMSGLKSNMKSLPGNSESFEDDKVAAIRIDIHEVAALLDHISSLFESGLGKHDIEIAVHSIERLGIHESDKFYYNVYYNGSLAGLTVVVTMDQPAIPILYVITEESLAYEIRRIMDFFHVPYDGIVH